ncbi:PAS domain-containing hybrid sensor histidine kinase/response regulator [Pseudoalteromonas sp. T1lg23B]|uniref:PAS domain-containing hybrid sensor histidine kinase/response regulator n=1 Tax=Pseudoalteromonas sp. T1lg23B TaxID=2077097 RepID=UPI000CF5F631|nr:PAS domain-containing hybrid sensor histidine kinase/response regulator [Pseudoalteromonas sp. T1lg23B]
MKLEITKTPALLVGDDLTILDLNDAAITQLMLQVEEVKNQPVDQCFGFPEKPSVTLLRTWAHNRVTLTIKKLQAEVIILPQEHNHFLFLILNTIPLEAYEQITPAEQVIGSWMYNAKEHTFQFSNTCAALLALTEKTAVPLETLVQSIDMNDRETLISTFDKADKDKAPFHLSLKTAHSLDSTPLQLICQGTQDDTDKVILKGLLKRDIYSQVLNCKLHEQNESRKRALEGGRIGTWSATQVGTQWFVRWDEQTCKLLHEPLDQNYGDLDKWISFIHSKDADEIKRAIEHSIKSKENFEREYRCVLKDGNALYIYAKGVVSDNKQTQTRCLDGVIIDHTSIYEARMRLEESNLLLEAKVKSRTEELNQAVKHAEMASQSKSEFLSMMSHELRTPMNAIIGALDLLTHQDNSFEEQELLDTAAIAANNLVSILNDILDINKIEAGKLELDCYDFDVSDMLNNIIVIFGPIARQKGVKLSLYESVDIPIQLNGDENRIRQVLFNLVSNAIKFSCNSHDQAGHVVIDVTCEQVNRLVNKLILSVKDDGIGIDNDTLKRLFTPFTQADKSTTRRFGGTGLGLAICGRLIELMGGEIIVNSELGKGSEFIVSIPIWNFKPREHEVIFSSANIYHHIASEHKVEYLVKKLQMYIDDVKQAPLEQIVNIKSEGDELSDELNIVVITAQDDIRTIDANSLPSGRLLIIYSLNMFEQLKERFTNVMMLDLNTLTFFTLHKYLLCLKNMDSQALLELNEDDFEVDLDFELDASMQSNTQVNTVTHAGNLPILIVEDNEFNQKLMVKQLSRLGYQCELASDGMQGLKMWKKGDYALVLTDCHMPIMDGFELTRQIRTEENKSAQTPIPIIAVTGAAMKGDQEFCLSVGMSDFISKPVTLDKFKNTIEKWYGH